MGDKQNAGLDECNVLPLHHLQEFHWSRTLKKCQRSRLFGDYLVSSLLNAVQILFTDISQGQARVEAPAACLINCHFTVEERGSSVFTTACKCPPGIHLSMPMFACVCVCMRLVTMSTAVHLWINSNRKPHTSTQRSRPECDFFSVPQTVHIWCNSLCRPANSN